jgi:thiol:disulfide interchange protein DsbD
MRALLIVAFGLTISASPVLSPAQSVVTAPHLRGAIATAPGSTKTSLRVRIVLDVSPGWHIGASQNGTRDLPTRLAWHLPDGFKVLSTKWPKPTRLVANGDTTFTYSGRVAIETILEAKMVKARDPVGVVVSYGVCREVCIPGHITLRTTP